MNKATELWLWIWFGEFDFDILVGYRLSVQSNYRLPFDSNLWIRIPCFHVSLSSPPFLLSPPNPLPILPNIHLSHLLHNLVNGGLSDAWRCGCRRHSSRISLLCLPVSSLSLFSLTFILGIKQCVEWFAIVGYSLFYFKRFLLRLLWSEASYSKL